MLILMRHGNTFKAGETATWVGARTDLPLTTEGHAQAQHAAAWLEAQGLRPTRLIAGPLRRTREFAAATTERFGLLLEIDNRLRELDYGLWENQSSDQIKAAYGPEELEAWEHHGQWPRHAGWPETEADVRNRLTLLLNDIRSAAETGTPVLCTSNGILRLIRSIVEGRPAGRDAKVATGRLCQLMPEGSSWRIGFWNMTPDI